MANSIAAQPQVVMDTAKIEVRSFKAEQLDKLKQNPDFQYNNYKEPPKNIWERFWSWVWARISQLLSTIVGKNTAWSLASIFAIATIIFFFVKVTGMNKTKLFSRGGNSGLAYKVLNDDIHSISFDDAINEAIANGNLRLAIRLLYLQSLKKLSDNEYIQWRINKTNSDYILEVMNKPWCHLFKTLTRQFEYSWYGEMNLKKDEFDSLQLQFQQFNNQL